MRVAIYQPQYFPRLHYFNRAFDSDVFVVLGTAQYTKRLTHNGEGGATAEPSFQSQTPIKAPAGTQLLRVPIVGSRRQTIDCTAVSPDRRWRASHLRTIEYCYRRAPFLDRYAPEIAEVLARPVTSLGELNARTFVWAATRMLNVDVPVEHLTLDSVSRALAGSNARLRKIVDGRAVPARPDGARQGTNWTIDICRSLQATEYVHGATALHNYMDTGAYHRAGIRLVEQSWRPDAYAQLHTRATGFVPNLSVLDALLTAGPDLTRAVVLGHSRSAARPDPFAVPSPQREYI